VTSPGSSVDAEPPFRFPRATYIHVPFCAHRCGYCDFTLISGRDDLVGDYLRALDRELQRADVAEPITLDTLFFGGGTPTYPDVADLRTLLQIVLQRFQVADSTEFSVEANPLDLTDEKIELLVRAGVNRFSLGVQSFAPAALKILERNHSPDQVVDAINRLRPKCRNISLDLIFGVPGQTLEDWRDTVRRGIDQTPTHISTYGLTFERGTAFWTRRERGEISPVGDDLERDQYALAIEELSAAGYEQYEISNFAQPGFQCRHNHVYWNGDEYWAFGPGAASYLHGRRQTNIRSVYGWLTRLERLESPVAETEELNDAHRARELIYLGLRRNSGINRAAFAQRTGTRLDDLCGRALAQQIGLGLLEDDGQSVRLTPEGRFVADRVVMEFL
jgi:oxygen-independent coproporphyrinogen III oxidase